MTTLTTEERAERIAANRANVPEALQGPTDAWRRIPGSTEATRHRGVCAAYAGESPAAAKWRTDGTAVAYWMVFRWTVWSYGTLLAEGFAEYESAAMFAADQALDNAEHAIREAIKRLDIRGLAASW